MAAVTQYTFSYVTANPLAKNCAFKIQYPINIVISELLDQCFITVDNNDYTMECHVNVVDRTIEIPHAYNPQI